MPGERKQSVTIAPGALKTPRRRSSVVPSDKMMGRRRSTLYSLNLRRKTSKVPELTEEQRRALARDRFRRAVFKVKAMIRFGLPLRAPPKTDDVKEKEKKNNVNYEPTYRLEPEEGDKFKPETAQKCLLDVLTDNLRTYKYSRISAPNFARALSTMCVDRMKSLGIPRYKYVCNVIIGENKDQSFEFASRSVWNTSTDNMATATLKTATFFSVATVHAVYLE